VTMAVGMRGVIAEMIATMTVAVVMAMYSAEIAGFSPD
jgi:hypothetical protein